MRKFEVFFSSLAAIACIALTLYLASWISTFQSLWPFPALYLIELCLLALIAWFFSFRDLPHASTIIWGIAGAFLGFFVLAGFSIGPFYFPLVLIFAAVALLSDLRRKNKVWTHLGILIIGGFLQAGLVLLILQLILKPQS